MSLGEESVGGLEGTAVLRGLMGSPNAVEQKQEVYFLACKRGFSHCKGTSGPSSWCFELEREPRATCIVGLVQCSYPRSATH